MRILARTSLSVLVLAVVFSAGSVASADKLSDFKTAADKKGCEAIPYSSERNDCKTYSRAKDETCKNFSCDLPRHQKLLDKLKEKRTNLEEAKKRKNENAARDLENTISKVKTEIDEARKAASINMAQAQKCIDARQKVQRHFDQVRALVEREREEALKPFITKLADHYKSEKEVHQRPIKEVEKARDNCKDVSRMGY